MTLLILISHILAIVIIAGLCFIIVRLMQIENDLSDLRYTTKMLWEEKEDKAKYIPKQK